MVKNNRKKELYLQLCEMSESDLREKMRESKVRYNKLRMSHKVSPLSNPMKIRELRRDIARMLTILNAKTVK